MNPRPRVAISTHAALLTLVCGLGGCTSSNAPSATATPPASSAAAPPNLLAHEVRRIDGTPESLENYRGKVVMVVNVASRCGLTPQYEQLEALYRELKDEGFVVLGFPANEFLGQEPGTNEEIAAFCAERFDVTFPMFEKIVVKGSGVHPLYASLAQLSEEPSWNFTKYIIDREGHFVERIGPRTRPDDPAVLESIRTLLEG
jgi:glutathione peroxidase